MSNLVALLLTLISITDFVWSSGSFAGYLIHNHQGTTTDKRTNDSDSSLATLTKQDCAEANDPEFRVYYVMDTCLEYYSFEFGIESYARHIYMCEQMVADYTDYEGELVSNDFTDEQWRMIPGLSVRNEKVKFYTNEGPTAEDPDLCATIHLTDDGSNENYTDFTIIRGQTDPCYTGIGFDYVCIISY